MNSDDLLKLDAGSWYSSPVTSIQVVRFSPEFAGTRFPTLFEALKTCSESGLNLNLEIKHLRNSHDATEEEIKARARTAIILVPLFMLISLNRQKRRWHWRPAAHLLNSTPTRPAWSSPASVWRCWRCAPSVSRSSAAQC